MSGGTTPAGWYPDPNAPGQERWFDGVAWSDATRAAEGSGYAAPPPPPSGFSPPPPPSSFGSPLPPPPGAQIGYGAPQFAGGMGGTPPNNYLVFAILTTLFCCLPFGIVSIVQSSKVDGLYRSGDYAGAQKASEDAKKWAIVSAVVSLVLIALYFIVVVAIVGTSDDVNDFDNF